MPQFSSGNVTLSFPVESLESLHVVGERSLFQRVHDGFVDWKEFFKFVAFLTCMSSIDILYLVESKNNFHCLTRNWKYSSNARRSNDT